MLRLSKKGEYGVMAMFELARDFKKGPLSIKEISRRQGVSTSYLEQLLNRLRKADLIKSQRGPGGGYVLHKKPSEISLGKIMNTLEGPVAISQCLDPTAKDCSRVQSCVTRLLWKSLGEKIENYLETVSLNDLLKEEKKLSK